MQAVILAAGKSTRTYPLTLTRPKPLLPVMNRPILAHQLDALAGIADSVALVVGYRQDQIREQFGDRYDDIAIQYIEQAEQKGTGHALLQCADAASGACLVLNGDDLFDAADLRSLANAGQGGLGKRVADPSQFGVYTTDALGAPTGIVEKSEQFVSDLANIGAYSFGPAVFEILDSLALSARGEIELTSAIQVLAERGEFSLVEAQGAWLPVGFPWDLLTANTHFLEHHLEHEIHGSVSPAAHIEGRVSIGANTVIRPGVVIDGPVCIGEGCTIGPNAWIRPYSSIGDGCKIGQASEIKGSVLFDGAKVPHLSYVGDSVVGANANLGCGTVTANFRHDGKTHRSMVRGALIDTGLRKFGAIIGDDVHTGINTSIYPGRKLWPGTSTLPGEVVERDKES